MIEKQILTAIEAEISSTPDTLFAQVAGWKVEGGTLIVYVNGKTVNPRWLDEAEGASVWWKGLVEELVIQSVDLEPGRESLMVSGSGIAPPPVNGEIRVTFPCYLRALHSHWSDSSWAGLCLDRLDRINRANPFDQGKSLASSAFTRKDARKPRPHALPRNDGKGGDESQPLSKNTPSMSEISV